MHNPNPHKLTEEEWRELGSLPVIRESWGLEEQQDPLDLASLAYGARFDFVSRQSWLRRRPLFASGGRYSGANGPPEGGERSPDRVLTSARVKLIFSFGNSFCNANNDDPTI